MTKEFFKHGKKKSYDGWVDLSLGNFGLGFSFHNHGGKVTKGGNLQINILFFEFYISVWWYK